MKELNPDHIFPGSLAFTPCLLTISSRKMQEIPTFAFFFLRGGVLEPEGTVEIKFRQKDLTKAMKRIDPVYKKLVEKLGE